MVDPSSKQKARNETRKSIAQTKRANRKSLSEGQNEATTLVPLDQLEASQQMTTAALRAKQRALDKAKRKKKTAMEDEISENEEEKMTLSEEREARKLAEEQLEDALLEVERMQVMLSQQENRTAISRTYAELLARLDPSHQCMECGTLLPENFAPEVSNSPEAFKDSSIELMMAVVSAYQDGAHYLAQSFPLLRATVQFADDAFMELGESTVVIIVQLMTIYSHESTIQEEGCIMLNILIGDKYAAEISSLGGLNAVVDAMAGNPTNDAIQEWGSECLLGMAQSGPLVQETMLGNLGSKGKTGMFAVDVVQTLLETRPDSRRLQALGCSVMLTLAQGSEPHRHILNNRGVPFLITQAMEAHTGLHFGGNFDELKTWLSNCVSRRKAVNANVNKYKEKKGSSSGCAIV